MSNSIVSLTVSQILVLFIFMLCGYVFKKKNIINDALSTVISRLEVYIFLPALCFNTFAGNFNPEILKEKSAFLIIGVVVLSVTFLPALLLSRLFTKNPMTRGIYLYAFTVPNFGYMGYPLILAVYGEQMLLNFMIVAIPYNIFIYTVGKYILSADRRFNPRNLLDPVLIGIVIGSVAGLTGLKLPVFLGSALSMAAACMAPLAMIMTGFVLARTPFKFNISNPKIYLASALRLLIIPLAAGGIMLLLHVRPEVMLTMTAFLCMPMGLNNVIFPEAYGGDSGTGAQCCFVSQVLGLLTIPGVFALMGMWG
ncbi:permease [Spirochaetia bacterium]|nr:permease [Spirochaetia bacterium]